MAERQTHNYIRHGTLDLFAALNVATGEVPAAFPEFRLVARLWKRVPHPPQSSMGGA